VVIVNDSARGAGLEIPLQTFYESWRDSDFRMTVTDIAAAPTALAAAFNTEAPDYATLGMTMQPSLAESYGLGLEEVTGASLETVPAEETPVPWCTAPIEIVTPDVAATEAAISGSPGMPVAYERYSGCATPVPSIAPDTNEGTFAPTAGPVAMESAPAPAPATVAFEPLPAPPAADPLAGTVIAGTNGTLPLNFAAPSAGSVMTIGDTGLYPSTMTIGGPTSATTIGGPSDPTSAILGSTTVGGLWTDSTPLGVQPGNSIPGIGGYSGDGTLVWKGTEGASTIQATHNMSGATSLNQLMVNNWVQTQWVPPMLSQIAADIRATNIIL
jgi:hypothetical protein